MADDVDRYRRMFSNMLNGFAFHEVVLDEAGRPVDYIFLEVNHAFETLTGLSAEAIVGKRVTEVIPGIENDPADWIGRYGHVALTGEDARFEQFAQLLNRWYSIYAYQTGERQFAAIFEDITLRKVAEEKLTESLRRFEILTTCTKDNIFITGPDRRYRYVNEAMADLFHMTREDLIGKKPGELLGEGQQAIIDGIDDKAFAGEVVDVTTSLSMHGEERHFHAVQSPIFDDTGRVTSIIGVVRDVTAHKKAEKELADANRRVGVANRNKNKFVAMVAHDLKGPLGSLISFLRLIEQSLRHEPQTHTSQTMLPMMKSALLQSDRMLLAIDELLELHRYTVDGDFMRPSAIDVRQLIDETFRTVAAQASDKEITLVNETPERRDVLFPRKILAKAISALVVNGVKFCGAGDRVTVRLNDDHGPVIEVFDTGPGVATRFLPHLFDYGVKTASTGSAGEPGTGLGLPLIHDLMLAAGGGVEVDKTKRPGAGFALHLTERRNHA